MRIGPFTSWEFAVVLVVLLIMLAPLIFLWRIFGKAGLPEVLALLLLLPGVGLVIALGILAYRDWPAGPAER